jgi:hypothetical protein
MVYLFFVQLMRLKNMLATVFLKNVFYTKHVCLFMPPQQPCHLCRLPFSWERLNIQHVFLRDVARMGAAPPHPHPFGMMSSVQPLRSWLMKCGHPLRSQLHATLDSTEWFGRTAEHSICREAQAYCPAESI